MKYKVKGGSLASNYVMGLGNTKCVKKGGSSKSKYQIKKEREKEWKVLIDKCSKTNKNIQSIFDCASKVFNKKYPRKKRSKKKNPKNTKKLHKTKTRKTKTRKTKRRM